jgi:hypothetical protein
VVRLQQVTAEPEQSGVVAELESQLLRLKRAKASLESRHDQITDWLLRFPSEATAARYRGVAADLAETELQVTSLEARLVPLRQRRP